MPFCLLYGDDLENPVACFRRWRPCPRSPLAGADCGPGREASRFVELALAGQLQADARGGCVPALDGDVFFGTRRNLSTVRTVHRGDYGENKKRTVKKQGVAQQQKGVRAEPRGEIGLFASCVGGFNVGFAACACDQDKVLNGRGQRSNAFFF